MSGYSDSIFTQSMAGFFARSRSAVLDYKTRREFVSKSRVLLQSVPLAKAIIDVLTRGVVGSGLHLGTDNQTFEAVSTLRGFDYSGELDFYQMQQQTWETALACGECFLIRMASDSGFSSWRIVEPDHVFNPPYAATKADGQTYYKSRVLIEGIEFDAQGKPRAVHFCANPYGVNVSDRKAWQRIPLASDGVQNVIHVRLCSRPEYPRGLPVLSPLIETLYGLHAYQTAQIQMGIIQSCQAFVVKTEQENKSLNPFQGMTVEDLSAPLIPEAEEKTTPQDFTIAPPNNSDVFGMTSTANYIKPGTSYHLGTGESIEHLKTESPSNNLVEYYDLVLAECASALGIPKAILSNVFDTSFSSCKASIAQWNAAVKRHRALFVSQCLRPFYRVFLQESGEDAAAAVRLSMASDWRSVDPPLFADESKTMRFYIDAVDAGLITRDEAAQALFGHRAEGTVDKADASE